MTSGSNETILLREDRDGICTLTLNRPEKRNALSSEMLSALQAAFTALEGDKSIKVIVIAANGPIFSSGHDLKEIREDSDYDPMKALFDQCSDMMMQMKQQPQPIIAKIQGTAMAAGCQLVANCDLAVAADTAKFALPGSAIGLFCSTPAVAVGRVVSSKHAMELLLMGEPVSAEDAYRFGLINKAVPIEQLDAEVLRYAEKIAGASSMTMSMGKPAFYQQMDMELADAYAHTSDVMARNMQEHDAREGIDAFLEKRKPTWRGR